MNAVDTIRAILDLGEVVKAGHARAVQRDSSIGWARFLSSPEFREIEKSADGLMQKLTPTGLDQALAAVKQKQGAIRRGRSLSELSPEERHALSSLADAETLLVNQQLRNARKSAEFFEWLVSKAVPVLFTVAKVLIMVVI